MTQSKTTTDHDEIRRWIEDRNGRPGIVQTRGVGGILRIDFAEPEESLKPVDWDEFFRVFDRNNLAFLYQEETGDGETSRFNKFISRP
ncbi:hypothetical protein [Martelella sp.]|uniref:hypothetical protein n=1 Tax=Martelella sp. TaxID=1969699 RepID=UPI0032420806